jgi:flagellin
MEVVMIKFDSNNTGSLLQQVQQKQSSLMEKLASGKQVNSAADGPAAQLIIDRLTSQAEGSRQAISNAYSSCGIWLSEYY